MTTAREFTIRLASLLRREHGALAEFLVALADFDGRRLWLELGHASLFAYLHRELGLSKGAAHYRKVAAELVREFPEVVEPLRDGRLCITSVVELAKVLSHANRDDVLPRFFHCSRREAAEIVAALRPHAAPPRREIVTALPLALTKPVPSSSSSLAAGLALRTAETGGAHFVAPVAMAPAARVDFGAPSRAREAAEPPSVVPAVETPSQSVQLAEHPDANSTSASPSLSPQPQEGQEAGAPVTADARRPRDMREASEPLTADLRRLHVTVSRRFLAKLEAARAALSHSAPGATAEQILEAGLDLVLAEHAKRKGLVAKPRKDPPTPKSDRVPAHVRREVWTRDGGRCQWPLDGGGVCGSTWRVELDHVVPRARGGPSTVDNGRLLCSVHNQYAARLAFGDEWMGRFTLRAPGTGPQS